MVYIEGNIGAGKSTILRKLSEQKKYQVREEPVDKWVNLDGINLLNQVSKQPEKCAFMFQIYALVTVWEQSMSKVSGTLIMERSVHSVEKLFSEVLIKNGHLQQQQLRVLQAVSRILRVFSKGQEHFIYLRLPAQEAFKRAYGRGRQEENSLKQEYFDQLHHRMDEWLLQEESLPVTIVNANQSKEAVYRDVLRTLEQLGL